MHPFIYHLFALLAIQLTTHYLTPTQSTLNLHQQALFATQFFTNMVQNTFDFIHEVTHHSLIKPIIKPPLTQQYLVTKSLTKTRLTPLMAQPYEVINVTSSTSGSTQEVQKPPDKPNG